MRQQEYAGRQKILPSSQATNPSRPPAIQRPRSFPSSSSAVVTLLSLPSPDRNTSTATCSPAPPAIQQPSPAAESCHRLRLRPRLRPCHGNRCYPTPAGAPAVSHSRRPAAAAPRQSALASVPPASRSKIGSHGSHRKMSPLPP